MNTARFKEVVAHSGEPELHLAWSAPATDKALQSALREHRVLTIHQQTRGAKRDYGVVGIESGRNTQFLIFPKSLRPFAEKRVVGIDYELLNGRVSMGGKVAAPDRPKPTTTSRSKKVIRFEAPTAAPAPPKEIPPAPAATAFSEPEESDPVKREIARALAELKAGHSRKAQKRLAALLEK